MNILFEIPDIAVAIICIILVLLVVVVALIIKHSSRKVLPISEDDRYDNDEIYIEDVNDEEITDEQKEAKEELARVFKRMSADLEKQKEAADAIDEFERDQEENAIISYQELLAHAEKLKSKSLQYEKSAEDRADISIKDASKTFEVHEDYKNSMSKNVKTFKSSDIVSPIYGVQSNKNMVRQKKSSKNENRDIISKAYERDLFEEEKTQNLDFLNSLKEFRKNL